MTIEKYNHAQIILNQIKEIKQLKIELLLYANTQKPEVESEAWRNFLTQQIEYYQEKIKALEKQFEEL